MTDRAQRLRERGKAELAGSGEKTSSARALRLRNRGRSAVLEDVQAQSRASAEAGGNFIERASGGAAEQFAATADALFRLPANIAIAAGQAVGLDDDGTLTALSQQIGQITPVEDFFRSEPLGLQPITPEGAPKSISRTVGRNVAAAAEFAVPLLKAGRAPTALRTAERFSREGLEALGRSTRKDLNVVRRTAEFAKGSGKTVVGATLEQAAKSPGVFLAEEVGAAAGAGGLRGGVEALGITDPTILALAELGGSLTPTPISALARGAAGKARRTLSESAREVRANQEASTTISASASDPERALQNVQELAVKLDALDIDIQPMLSEGGGDIGLRALRRDLFANDPKFANEVQRRRAEAVRELERAFDDVADTGVSNAASAQEDIRKTRDALLESAQKRLDVAQANVERRIAEAGGGTDRATASEIAAEEFDAAHRSFKDVQEKLYSKVSDDNTLRLGADPERTGFRAFLEKIKAKEIKRLIPKEVDEMLEKMTVTDAQGNVTKVDDIGWQDMRNIEESLNNVIGKSKVDPEFRTQGRIANKLKTEIRRSQDAFELTSDVDERARALKVAREFTSEGLKIYRDGTVGKILSPSRSPVEASDTLKQFFTPGRSGRKTGAKERALDFHTTLERMRVDGRAEGATRASKAMDDHIVDDFVSEVTKPGEATVDPVVANRYLKKYSDALDTFPETRKRLESIRDGGLDVREATAARNTSQKEWENSVARVFAEADPDEAVRAVLQKTNSRKAMKELMAMVEPAGQDGRRGIQRAILDDMRTESFINANPSNLPTGASTEGVTEIGPTQLKNYIQKNRGALEEAFSPEQIKQWGDIADAGIPLLGETLPTRTRPRLADITKEAVTAPKKLATMWLWRSLRKRSVGDLASSIFAAKFVAGLTDRVPSLKTQQVLERALLDGNFGADILKPIPLEGAAREAFAIKLHGHLLSIEEDTKRKERK